MNYLALDLGTRTGWASLIEGKRDSGTWLLASNKELKAAKVTGKLRTGDPRYFMLCRLLRIVVEGARIDVVGFEDVKFSVYTAQTQLWSSLRTAVWTVFQDFLEESRRPQILPVPVQTLKKFGANHGGATKLMMAAWLLKKHPDLFRKSEIVTGTKYLETQIGRKVDDNEIDANHLLDYLLHANLKPKS